MYINYEYSTLLGMSDDVPLTRSILSNADVVHPIGEQARVVSSSIEDDKVPVSIGVQKVLIVYFTSTWEYKQEVVELNGTTPVNTTELDIYRIQSFTAIQDGSNDVAVGTIRLESVSDSGARLFAQIDPDSNSFKRALHYVRRGYICRIVNTTLSCSTSPGVEFHLYTCNDYTSIGGEYIHHRFVPVDLENQVLVIPENTIPIIDASQSAKPLTIYMCAEGFANDQDAHAYFYLEERQVIEV